MKVITVQVLGYDINVINDKNGNTYMDICNLGAKKNVPRETSLLSYHEVSIYNCITGQRPSPKAIANCRSDCIVVGSRYYLDITRTERLFHNLIHSPYVHEDHRERAQMLLERGFISKLQKAVKM